MKAGWGRVDGEVSPKTSYYHLRAGGVDGLKGG